MDSKSLPKYLSQPNLLYRVDYDHLKSLAEEYPYCGHLHHLMAMKCKVDARKDWEKHLHKAAFYSPDRAYLYCLLYTSDAADDRQWGS